MKSLICALLASALLALGSSAPAEASTYYLGNVFSGTADPGCTGPNGSCLTATFSSTATPGTIQLTLDATLAPGEFIDSFYFNLDPTLNPSNVTVTYLDAPTSTDTDSTTTQNPFAMTGTNAFKADGTGGNFDFLLQWPGTGANGGVNRFTGTETSIWTLVLSGLTPGAFDFLSCTQSGSGPNATCGDPLLYYVAAHIQGITCTSGTDCVNGTTSVWITTPLPPAILLFGSGLVGLGFLTRRRRRRAS